MLKRLPVLAALLASLAALVLVAPAGAARNKTVSVRDDFFGPKTLTVAKGARVTWRWRNVFSVHNVTLVRGPGRRFHSPTKSTGTFSHRFTRKGTYRFVCTIHAPNMHMTITVR